PLWSTQDSIHDLAFEEAAQERDVLRIRQQVEQPAARAEELLCDRTNGHGRTIRRHVKHVELLAAEELTNNRDIQLKRDGKTGRLVACFGHSGYGWQIHGGKQVA